jgi:hypothetical protein
MGPGYRKAAEALTPEGEKHGDDVANADACTLAPVNGATGIRVLTRRSAASDWTDFVQIGWMTDEIDELSGRTHAVRTLR